MVHSFHRAALILLPVSQNCYRYLKNAVQYFFAEIYIVMVLICFHLVNFLIYETFPFSDLYRDFLAHRYQFYFINDLDLYELKMYLFNEFWLTYQLKMIEFSVYGDEILRNVERSIVLLNTDQIWRDHLQKMELLREAVGWRGYGQRNPLYEYKEDAFYMFKTREELLRHLVIYDLLRSFIL